MWEEKKFQVTHNQKNRSNIFTGFSFPQVKLYDYCNILNEYPRKDDKLGI